eukprot:3917777-Rhodomonas_salina.1
MVSGEVISTPCVQDRVPGLVREHPSLDFSLAEGEAVVCCPSSSGVLPATQVSHRAGSTQVRSASVRLLKGVPFKEGGVTPE